MSEQAQVPLPQDSKVAGTAPGYVLGSSDPERQRLVRQARVFAAEASWLLDQAGAKPGWRAVDVGCGPIGIMDLLCDRVGPTGETIGVDSEARMIAMARDVAAELNLANLTLVEAEATGTGLERASFDFAHARLLLVNVPDPERVVAELAALVRPGGVVALEELELGLVDLPAAPSRVGPAPGCPARLPRPPGPRRSHGQAAARTAARRWTRRGGFPGCLPCLHRRHRRRPHSPGHLRQAAWRGAGGSRAGGSR